MHLVLRPLTGAAAALAAFNLITPAHAYDITDSFSINAVLAATGQCQDPSARLPAEDYDESGLLDAFDDECRGGMPFQVELEFNPTDRDQFFAKLGWAADNGLNPVSPFRLAPWAADLEDDVEDINGSGRDYLLTAWYRHAFSLGSDSEVGATFGLIDSTDYLDGNEYANDEFTQFMNEVFVNSGIYSLQSYAPGATLEGVFGSLSLTALAMNVAENDDGNNFNYWALQAGWHPELAFGTGNYRVMVAGTGSDFLDPDGIEEEALLSYGLSFDQPFGENLGLFLRMTWQEEDAAVDYNALYSGGVHVGGGAWGRADDHIGLGYAYLEGGNTDVDHTSAFEAYYSAQLNDYLALTADVQYMSDSLETIDPAQEDPEGWILGVRAVAAF